MDRRCGDSAARGCSPLERRRLGFDPVRQRGAVFHMLSSMDRLGLAGLTAISDDPSDAARCYERARAVLLRGVEPHT